MSTSALTERGDPPVKTPVYEIHAGDETLELGLVVTASTDHVGLRWLGSYHVERPGGRRGFFPLGDHPAASTARHPFRAEDELTVTKQGAITRRLEGAN